ncbi:hypothetical protein VNI00_005791 [Paramarasmius palmivorus]|uniref:Heme haloperoxidase family profile domain-containing protein n=1 Tax=Paramarasmius palmivorus TaxID=297713 RepID=A0AAW0DDA3_9AGAR
MKLQSLLTPVAVAITFVGGASAVDPHDLVDWSKHQFEPAKPTDARGPCPGLNTLANHGFLPRDGRNISIPTVLKAGLEGFNVHRELLILAAKAGLLASDLDEHFSLADIALHGNIEHDASVSRQDRNLGDNVKFNEDIYTTLANSNPGLDYYNATSAGMVQMARMQQSQTTNPNFRNTIKEFQIRTRESALYLMVMGNPETGAAPKKFVDIFFREERLPLEEGWKIPKVPINQQTESPVFDVIRKNSGWVPEAGQCPWVTLAQGAPEDPVNDGSIL